MFVAGVVTKKGIFFVSTLSKEKVYQHRALHLDTRPAGEWSMQMTFFHGCLKLYDHYKIHTYRLHIF